VAYQWLTKPKWLILLPLVAILLVAVACGDDATPEPQVIEKEVIKEVPVEVVKEVPVEVIKEVIKEVPKEVVKEVEVPVEVIKEIEVQVPVTRIAIATSTPGPAMVMSKVTRLKFATPAPWVELTVPWDGDTWGTNLAVRNHMEPLIERHYKTGEMIPLLANSWTMDTSDAKNWTFNLKQGVPFSYGWGDFSAQDVAHVIRQVTADGAIPSDNAAYRIYLGQELAERESRVVQVDDHTVTFNLKVPEPDFNAEISASHGVMLMHSKRQWDEAGEAVSRSQAAGTGPWKFIKHTPGFSLLWEAKENHHKKSPEFKEFEMVLSPEPATRMAMLLTGEAHMAELPRDLHAQMVAQGLKVQSSEGVATQIFYLMAGAYLPDTPAYQHDGVFASVKVREAVNRAINREQIINQIFKGVGVPQRVFTGHPDLYGWDNRFETEWEEKYGYDVEKAKQLIKDAGFEGASVEVMSFTLAGLPEASQMAEVLQQELKAIGLNATITSQDWARLFERLRNRQGHGMVWPQKTSFTTSLQVTRWYNTDTGCCSTFVDPFLEETHEKARGAQNIEDRNEFMRQILAFKFDNYGEAPLLWVPSQVIIDPKVIQSYTWPGVIDAGFDHFEYIVPAG
jgi:ABC-type transport system substrate-binding protein